VMFSGTVRLREVTDPRGSAGTLPCQVSVPSHRRGLDGCLRAAGTRLLAALSEGLPGPVDRAEPLVGVSPGGGIRVEGPHGCATSSVHGWRDQDGPYDELCAQAMFGLMAVHGRAAGRAEPIGVPYVSSTVASLTLQGALVVAVGRLRGLGIQHATVSLPAAAALTVVQYLAAATAAEDPEIGQPQQPRGTVRPPFRSADGVVLELEALDAEPWRAFWVRLGADPGAVARSWRPFVLRYPTATCGLSPQLHQALGQWSYAELESIAAQTGMSLCAVRGVAQRRTDPDVVAAAGAPPPWQLSTLADTAPTSPPHGMRDKSGRLPLEGVRVVESCRRVQGPLAGRLLALLGAEVVRIEPPGGDPLRGVPPMADDCSARFLALNHGKQVVEADIRTRTGQAAVGELVREADVFVQNWAPGKAQQYRLDAEHLHRIRPELVYAQASAWGANWTHTDLPLGTDFMVQAHSGLAEALGDAGSPRPSLMTLLDLLGAHICVEAVLTGLVHRYLHGLGVQVRSSLLGAADVLLADQLHPRRGLGGAGSSCGAPPSPVAGLFDTADEPLVLAARTATSIDALCRVSGIPAPTHPQQITTLRGHLRPLLRTQAACFWLERLRAARIAAAVVRTDLTTLPTDPRVIDHIRHDGCAIVTSPWRFS
jgi:CoA:oxalate CoA-transferase